MAKSATAIALVHPALEGETETNAPRETNAQRIDRRKAEISAQIIAIGETVADASAGMVQALRLFGDGCRERVYHIAKSGDDAERIYTLFANANNTRANGKTGATLMPVDPKGSKSAISIFRAMGRPVVMAQGEDWIDRICYVKDALGSDCKLGYYMAIYRANTGLTKAQSEIVGKRFIDADDADIAGYIANKPQEQSTKEDDLGALIEKTIKVSQADHYNCSPDLIVAMEAFIKACGAELNRDAAQIF